MEIDLAQSLGILTVAAGVLIWAIRLEGRVNLNAGRLDEGDTRLRARVDAVEHRLDRGDKRIGQLDERDDAILKAINELRVAVARLEEKIDRRNGGG